MRDALWLSRMLQPQAGGRQPVWPEAPVPPDDTPPDAPEAESTGEDTEPAAEDAPEEPEPEPGPRRGSGFGTSGVPADISPLTWPTLSALPEARAIARALRPFMRTTASPWHTVLDEEGTAVRAAQDGLWLPEWRPAPWRRFDVALVTDTGPSMDIWRQTAREFLGLLRCQGAFRDVRHYQLDCSRSAPAELRLEVEAGPGTGPTSSSPPAGGW